MSNQVQTTSLQPIAPARPKRALEVMANRLNVEPAKMLSTLRNTCFKGATDDELLALVVVANEYGLNPFLKEIYAFPKKGGGIVPVVGVDGWVKMTNRHAAFDGVEFDMQDKDGKPYSCTCRIYIKGRTRPISISEYMDECHRNTDPWNQMPRRMLRHKALIQCARVACGFSGIYDEEEAIDIAATVTHAAPDEPPAAPAMSATVAKATSHFRPQVVPPPAAVLDDHAAAPAAEPPPEGDLPPVGDEEPPAADDGVDPNKPNLADSTALRDAVEGIGYTFWLFSRAAAEIEIDGSKEWRNWMDVPAAVARECCDNLPLLKARMARLKAEEAKARAPVPPTAKK